MTTYSLRRIRPEGTADAWLNDYEKITYSDIWNEIPSMTVRYPALGEYRSSLLRQIDNFTEVALFADGVEVPNGRIILDEQEYNPVDFKTEPITYSGAGVQGLLEWNRLWLELAAGDQLVYTDRNPGYIMKDLVNKFDSLWVGSLNPPRIWTDESFSTLEDSADFNWTFTSTLTLPRGYSLLQVVNDLKEQDQLFFRFLGRALQMYQNDYGVDRTVSPNPQVLLEAGRDIRSAKVRQTARNLVSATGGKAGGNLSRWWVPASFTRDFMVREEYLEDSNIGDTASRDRQLQLLLDQRGDKQREYTIELATEDTPFFPLVHYFAGDWIWVDFGGELGRVKLKILQLTVEIGEGGEVTKGSLILNDYLDPQPIRQVKWLRRLRYGRIKLPT